MKQYEISDAPYISEENFANLFNIYFKKETEEFKNMLTYSINKSIYFSNVDNMSPNNFTFYECKEKDSWSTISYSFYDTIELWWLICKVNNITDPVAFSPLPGQNIKLLNKDLVPSILQHLKAV